jgi:uncharacterized BrkB/YihY/UPF0761 family membrane protein
VWLSSSSTGGGGFDVSVSWMELFKRTLKRANDDDVLGLAAQLAYYFLLALVPALLFLVALTSFFPSGLIDSMSHSAAGVTPATCSASCRSRPSRSGKPGTAAS